MPIDDRYTHWQQDADEPILDYVPAELVVFTDLHEAVTYFYHSQVLPGESVNAPELADLTELTEDEAVQIQQAMRMKWESRARAIAAENAAQRAEDDDNIWPSL